MLSGIFRQDGALWRVLNLLTDIFALSTLWLLGCIPVFTAGASTAALYDAVAHCVRNKEPGPYRRFFRTLKNELKQSFLAELLWGAVIFLGVMTLNFLREMSGESGTVKAMAAAYYIIMIIPVGAACWCFPLLSRFSNTFGGLLLTALKFAVGYIPRTAVIVFLALETINLCINYIFPAFFAPALLMLLWTLFIEPVFAKLGGGLKKDPPEEKEIPEE